MPYKSPMEMTDEELDAELSGASLLAPAMAAAKERQTAKAPQVDNTQGMSGWELAAAGFAKPFVDVGRGVKELAVVAGGTPEEILAYHREKQEQQEIDRRLMSNWQANLGSLGGEAAISATRPAKLGSQVALAGTKAALNPTTNEVTGFYPMVGSRLLQGAEGGVSTAAIGYPLGLIGRAAGAATNRYTPEGKKAMALNEAANRIGVNRSIASLDPSSSSAAVETALPGYARTVEEQAGAFSQAARQTKDIPSKTGRSFESRVLEGENLRQAVEEAGKNLQNVGGSLWRDLDAYVIQNNLPPVTAKNSQVLMSQIAQKYTPITKKGPQLEKNPIIQRISEYDPDAATVVSQFLANPKQPPKMSFDEMHKLQSAVGKAMGRAEKDASAPGAPFHDRQARNELKNLYGSLMTDVDNWGSKNPTAQKMYEDARTFWRDAVVPGVLTNKVVSKSSKGVYGMNPRGYSEPSQLYSDVIKNPRAMQDLYPYMSQTGRDLTDTLQTMPDVASALIANKPHPPAPGMGTLTSLAGAAIGSPLQLAKLGVSHLPGAQFLTQSTPAKRLYFARDLLEDTPLGQVAYALGQKPQGDLEQGLRRFRVGSQK